MRGVYDAAIRDLDRASAALATELDRRGVLDDTIVVVVSDHGEAIGEHGIYGHNFSLYDELIHVPLVIRYPRSVPAARVTHPVSTADLYLTLTNLAGLPAAPRPFPHRALSEVEPGEPFFSELRAYDGWNPDVPLKNSDGEWFPLRRRYRVTVQDQFKAIVASDQSIALYDRLQDPGETRDLYTSRTEIADALAAAHVRWLENYPNGPDDLSMLEQEQRQSAQQDDLAEQLRALGYVQ